MPLMKCSYSPYHVYSVSPHSLFFFFFSLSSTSPPTSPLSPAIPVSSPLFSSSPSPSRLPPLPLSTHSTKEHVQTSLNSVQGKYQELLTQLAHWRAVLESDDAVKVCIQCTVESLTNGPIGAVHYREVVLFRRQKMYYHYNRLIGATENVLYTLYSECPLSEVPLYIHVRIYINH